ncbi:hypothetical protein LPUS_02357 [Lasallia pustulata]|uniref:Nascent polypeptide-associated complex subunit alpha-like UBA domain-containing protein n=1 Tax=Lasallia pustulata TaxID=136370 RepID=A0A1W5CSL4_9LECA|nr:hypothetical protein LPUS_02357 [Lasallia pustulata]
MAEPQPPQIREGADVDDETPAVPASAEDRKAAAALSSLDARGEDDEGTSKKPNLDQEALGKAMSRLELASKGKGSDKGKSKEGDIEKKKPVVKVDQADVALLVEQLELTKPKATELLRAHEGNAIKAMRAFVTASG